MAKLGRARFLPSRFRGRRLRGSVALPASPDRWWTPVSRRIGAVFQWTLAAMQFGFDTGLRQPYFVCARKIMAENLPTSPGGALPPKPAESSKVQPKKETVRINLPPKPTSAPTIKLPTLAPGSAPLPPLLLRPEAPRLRSFPRQPLPPPVWRPPPNRPLRPPRRQRPVPWPLPRVAV